MKAEALLTLLKKCVLCLFLCLISRVAFSQQVDTSLVSRAVTSKIVEYANVYDSDSIQLNIIVRGDSTIDHLIPDYLKNRESKTPNWLYLEHLRMLHQEKTLSIKFHSYWNHDDVAIGSEHSYVLDMDSLRKNYVAPIYPEEGSFWDDTLQPILVTAGAAAVIALFFFVKF